MVYMQKNGEKHTNRTETPFRFASFPPMVRLQLAVDILFFRIQREIRMRS